MIAITPTWETKTFAGKTRFTSLKLKVKDASYSEGLSWTCPK